MLIMLILTINIKKIELTMKKVFLLLSVFALVFASCSSNDDDDASIDPIVGTWK